MHEHELAIEVKAELIAFKPLLERLLSSPELVIAPLGTVDSQDRRNEQKYLIESLNRLGRFADIIQQEHRGPAAVITITPYFAKLEDEVCGDRDIDQLSDNEFGEIATRYARDRIQGNDK